MAKNDKIKEQLAESRHNERMALTWLTVGFVALSAAIAYGVWQGTTYGVQQGVGAAVGVLLLILIGFIMIWVAASRNRRERKELIEQLDNTKKEPTNKEIMVKLHKIQDELKKAELRDRVIAWFVLVSVGAGFALASVVAHQWWNVLIGVVFFIIGLLGVWRKWPPRW